MTAKATQLCPHGLLGLSWFLMTTKDRKRIGAIFRYLKSWGGNKTNANIHLMSEIAKITPITILSFTQHWTFILTERLSSYEESEIRGHFLPPRPDTFDESVLFVVIVNCSCTSQVKSPNVCKNSKFSFHFKYLEEGVQPWLVSTTNSTITAFVLFLFLLPCKTRGEQVSILAIIIIDNVQVRWRDGNL